MRYAYSADIQPPVGRRLAGEEHYDLEPHGTGCKVILTNIVTYIPGMTMDELDEEIALSTMACLKSLGKLRALAEGGVESVEALEREFGER